MWDFFWSLLGYARNVNVNQPAVRAHDHQDQTGFQGNATNRKQAAVRARPGLLGYARNVNVNQPAVRAHDHQDQTGFQGNATNRKQAAVRARPAVNQVRPWRRLESCGSWRLEYKDKLFMDIGSENMIDVDKPRVLIWGRVQAGKSTFINSIASVDKGRFAQLAVVADSATRVTRRLDILHLSNRMKNLRIIDVMGLERRGLGGLPADDVQFILRGHVRQNYEFDTSGHISQENETFFKADPSGAEKAYCNILVVSAVDVYGDLIESDMMETLRKVQTIARDAGIATILVLTKIDLACPEVQKDVTQVYCSAKIGEVVNKANSKFGIPKMDIFPVKNYTDEVEMETGNDILLLLAVRQIVRYVSDRLQQVNLSRN